MRGLREAMRRSSEPILLADQEFLMNTQEIMDMYERQAEQRGEQRGKLHGHREVVLRQLRRKFGELPEDVVARVQNADPHLLEQLEDNVLFGNSLEAVFNS
jgi:hypothetical protein